MGQEQLYKLDNANPRENVAAQYGEESANMKRLLNALFEFVKYRRYNNPPLSDSHRLAQVTD